MDNCQSPPDVRLADKGPPEDAHQPDARLAKLTVDRVGRSQVCTPVPVKVFQVKSLLKDHSLNFRGFKLCNAIVLSIMCHFCLHLLMTFENLYIRYLLTVGEKGYDMLA